MKEFDQNWLKTKRRSKPFCNLNKGGRQNLKKHVKFPNSDLTLIARVSTFNSLH